MFWRLGSDDDRRPVAAALVGLTRRLSDGGDAGCARRRAGSRRTGRDRVRPRHHPVGRERETDRPEHRVGRIHKRDREVGKSAIGPTSGIAAVLAANEMEVGRFYLTRNQLQGAIGRFKTVVINSAGLIDVQ